MRSIVYVGMDVHKDTVSAALTHEFFYHSRNREIGRDQARLV